MNEEIVKALQSVISELQENVFSLIEGGIHFKHSHHQATDDAFICHDCEFMWIMDKTGTWQKYKRPTTRSSN